ncbi:SDR family oxidoreductase [Dactylosporangium sp. CS-033363]|uniref:SDR family oxidoreductase n=1 Tax=Dactylosporangium sp. CS-033363 TaxID=3239935 RepID=UPI003D93FE32
MTITVTGATGHLGQLILRELKGQDVRAVARRPEAVDGVEARLGDYDRPETLTGALAGTDTLVFVSASEAGKRLPQHRNVIDAAIEAKVGRIVYTSITHADTNPIPLAPEHKATEELIQASGIPYTFLRNNWYLENYTGNLGATVENGAVLGAAGNGRIAAATRADFAAATAVVATTEGHENKAYELGGDQAFTLAELADAIAQRFGKPVVYRDLPADEYQAALESFGVPAGFAHILAQVDVTIAQGSLDVVTGDLSRLIGRPTTTVAEFLQKL